MKQKTIGLNPLEEYLTSAKAPQEEPEVPREEAAAPVQASEPATKQRITIHISSDVIDRVKNAVYWEPGLTLAGFAEEALAQALESLEAERGAPFPQRREHRLKGGRPII
jgi:hypothetical protein